MKYNITMSTAKAQPEKREADWV
jgi:hypothetical protein